MRILLIQLTGRGGTQIYTAQLANAISKKVKDAEVFVILGNSLFEEGLYDKSINLIIIKSPISYSKMLFLSLNPFTYCNLIKMINNIKPDVIHVTYEFLWDSVALQFLRKYPVIVTIHDPDFHIGTKIIVKLYMGISRYLIKSIYSKAIVHGENLKKILLKQNFRDKDTNVVPMGEFSYHTKWKKENIEETNSILFFGTIRDNKGLEYLIKAEPLITARIPDLKIIIAGAGDFNKYKKLIVNNDSYEILNYYIPDKDIAELFQKCRLVVLPYIGASQTGVIPTAYAFRKPVVATNVGGIPEIVEDGITGCIVPPEDHEALAKAIIKILSDDELRKWMSENVYLKTKTELSWDNISSEIYDIYSVAISNHHLQNR